MTTENIVVITVEGGVVQHIESSEPINYLVVDIDKNQIDSYTGVTEGDFDQVLECLMEHTERRRLRGELGR